MIEWTIRVPSKEECERKGFPCYNCDLRSITNCGIFRDHMLKEHETSAKETSKVTYEDIKKSVEELRKQKEKIERLQKEFIEEEVKNNPKFMGYYIDSGKKQISLYGLPIYSDPSVDKNTFIFQRSDGEIIKVGLPEVTVPLSSSALHYSSAPSGKIPIPSKEPTELEFHVAAGTNFGWSDPENKINIYSLDSKGKLVTLKEMQEKHKEAVEKASGRGKPGEKPEIPKRVLSRKVVLRESFC